MSASDPDSSEEPTDSDEPSTSEVPADPEGITIDVSPALNTAGHEAEDLGFEGLADSAPVLHDDDSDDVDFSHTAGSDIATRGQNHH